MVAEPPENPERQIDGADTQSFILTRSLRINVNGEHVSSHTMHFRPHKLITNAGPNELEDDKETIGDGDDGIEDEDDEGIKDRSEEFERTDIAATPDVEDEVDGTEVAIDAEVDEAATEGDDETEVEG
ncbi:hypothetical protein DERF_010443 [Dermatophagoides farinae]|uniref:Uncharacterized protein n=1 Tax=Dermatophagoides farinae TaxID=6954 RepID=A0A922HZB2_DERFA|nr:hypothetical protein DERF_010443 [Dermatophagoides farinae]